MANHNPTMLTRIVRAGSMLALTAVVIGSSFAPAQAQSWPDRHDNGNHNGWDKNGKEARKHEKADRRAADQRVIVVAPNARDRVIDRSQPVPIRRAQRTNQYGGYRNGGTRVYDYRTHPYYPNYGGNGNYGGYPSGNYGGYPSGGYQYGNPYGGYGGSPNYSNRRGNLSPEDVAERASRSGYQAGYERGAYDAQSRNRPNPQGHGAYQYGFDGFDPSWGSASVYQQYYRSYFIQGYNAAFQQRGNYQPDQRRRW